VYYGQTVGWIKEPLGTEVNLGIGNIVLGGDSAPPKRRTAPPPIFGPCLLWPNGRPPSDTAELLWLVLSDRCLSVCLSVTLVCCSQTVGWIRMPFGTEVGPGPDDRKRHSSFVRFPPYFYFPFLPPWRRLCLIFGRPFVKSPHAIRPLSVCLSVMLVYCGQTVRMY